jgi:hypothetical protein
MFIYPSIRLRLAQSAPKILELQNCSQEPIVARMQLPWGQWAFHRPIEPGDSEELSLSADHWAYMTKIFAPDYGGEFDGNVLKVRGRARP